MLIIKTQVRLPFLFFTLLTCLLIISISTIEISNDNNADLTQNQLLFIQQKLNGVDNVMNSDLTFVLQKQYNGQYKSLQKDAKLFNYITSKSGTIQAVLLKNELGNTSLDIDGFQMILFDPTYHDGRAIRVQIKLQNMTTINQWNSNNSNITVSKIYKQRVQSQQNYTNVNYSIRLQNIANKDPKQVKMYLNFQGSNVNFTATMTYYQPLLSALGYCLYMSFVAFLQTMSVYFLQKKMDNTDPHMAGKLSLATVAFCNIQDFYYTLTYVEFIMTSGPTTYLLYIIPSVFYIVLFVFLDMKLLLLTWKSRYNPGLDGPQGLRKKLATFYIKFYLTLFLYLALTFFFSYDVWMIILQNLILLPQIIHNARVGNNPGFEPLYVFGYVGFRFLVPLYERGCPYNHFMLTPMIELVIIIFILYIIQSLILYLQNKCGPRFFIPKIMQPDYYNYQYKIKINETNQDLECNICLQQFFIKQQSTNRINSSGIQQTLVKQRNVMKTPCGHFFHTECLTEWIDVKMECPTCRTLLPPL